MRRAGTPPDRIMVFMAVDWFPLWLSLRVAAWATLAAAPIGVGLAYLLANCSFRGKKALEMAVDLPLALPSTVLAYYLLVVLGHQSPLGKLYAAVTGVQLIFTWQAAVVAAFFHAAPWLVHQVRVALEQADHSYERAARTLGASECRVFFRVSLPLARRAVLAATVLAFARALGEFGVTIMIAGNVPGRTQTLAAAVYSAVESGAGAVARSLVLVISAVIVLLLWAASRLSEKRAS